MAATAVAVILGLAIAYVTSEPYWDNTAITVVALFAFSGFLGFLVPHRVWHNALGLGVWIPLVSLLRTPDAGTSALVPLLGMVAIPFAGAYGGRHLRVLMDASEKDPKPPDFVN